MVERRRSRRKKEVNKIAIEPIVSTADYPHKKINIAFTNDISLCGFKIITDTKYPVDSLMKVDISLSSAQKTINVTGIVRWVSEIARDTHEIGIEILDITKENIGIFYEHLYKYMDEK
jgi:hypothetical protein